MKKYWVFYKKQRYREKQRLKQEKLKAAILPPGPASNPNFKLPKPRMPDDPSKFPDFPNVEGLDPEERDKVIISYWLDYRKRSKKEKYRQKQIMMHGYDNTGNPVRRGLGKPVYGSGGGYGSGSSYGSSSYGSYGSYGSSNQLNQLFQG